MNRFFSFLGSATLAGRWIAVTALVLTGLIIQAPMAAADPLCPNNQPATLDPAFGALVQRVGSTIVGSVTACVYRAGNTGIFNQQTSRGSLSHNLDGSVSFVTSYLSPSPNQTWTLRPDGTFITPDSQQLASRPNGDGSPAPASNPSTQTGSSQSSAAPTSADTFDPNRSLTSQSPLPSDDPAIDADTITPGRYACYAQLGGSSSAQVLRGGSAVATKQINSDGSWRDTTYGSMTASNSNYAGNWSFDGTTLTLTWGNGSEDTFTPQLRTSGQPQLVEFGSDGNLTCYLV